MTPTFLALALLGAAATLDPAAIYPEGPLIVGDEVYFTEMGADRVSAWGASGKRVVWTSPGCGPTALAPYGDGLLVLCHRQAEVVALGADGREGRRWSRDEAGSALQNPNDASADGSGNVYFSDPGIFYRGAPATGRVMLLTADGALRAVAGDLHYANGVFFDRAERALYVDEHLARRILRYPVLADGDLGPPSVFADIDAVAGREGTYQEAGPDGLERGPDGLLYVCLYGEGRILKLSRAGTLVGVIKVPTPYVTNIAFAPDGSAYVTGSFNNRAPDLDGQLLRLPPE